MRSRSLTVHSAFLKERLFGLSNPQGNHGESVKEAHFHLDNTPVSRPAPVAEPQDPKLTLFFLQKYRLYVKAHSTLPH